MKSFFTFLSILVTIAMILPSGMAFIDQNLGDLRYDLNLAPPPAPPESVTVKPGSDYVDVSWEPPAYDGGSPITGYLIFIVQGEWVGAYPDTAPPVGRVGPDDRTFRHSGLTPGITYTYYVKAENAHGLSERGGWEWAIPGKTHPAEPTLRAKVGNSAIWLSGTVSDPGGTKILGYRLYRGIQNGNLSLLSEIEALYGNENFYYEDRTVMNEIRYYYRVSAYNLMGEGNQSSQLSVFPRPAPTSVTVFPRSVDNCGPVTIMINWSVPDGFSSNLTAFRIYGDHIQGFVEVGPANRSYEAHVSGGWGYRFQVSALFDDGNESFAEPVWAMTPMCEGGDPASISPSCSSDLAHSS